LRHFHIDDGGIKMGMSRLRLLEVAENDLRELKVKTCKQNASKGAKKKWEPVVNEEKVPEVP
jgi:hypothetical protein